jgi:hypothetical protein
MIPLHHTKTLGFVLTGVLIGYIVCDIIRHREFLSQGCEEPCVPVVRENTCWEGHSRKVPVLFKVDSLAQSDYGRPGLAHTTIAGRKHHGLQDIELWRQVIVT